MDLKKKDIDIAINWLMMLSTPNEEQEKNKFLILEYIDYLEENIDYVECLYRLEEDEGKRK